MHRIIGIMLLSGAVHFSGLKGADPATGPITTLKNPEVFLLLPEPHAMRSSISRRLWGAEYTVFTPARETADQRSVETYSAKEFTLLGLGWDSYLEKCRASADLRLKSRQPDFVKDHDGTVIYAVYRGPDPGIASLFIAPSLARIFTPIFGDPLWLIAPDRHSLFVFPAKSDKLAAFVGDLKERFESDPSAASEEIFELSKAGSLRVIANFTGRTPAVKAH